MYLRVAPNCCAKGAKVRQEMQAAARNEFDVVVIIFIIG